MSEMPFATDMEQAPDADSAPLRELQRLWPCACYDCRERCLARDVLFSIALGFKDCPRCLPCLSQRLHREQGELLAQLLDYVQRRECYRLACHEAQRLDAESPQLSAPRVAFVPEPAVIELPAEAMWDAGDMACGELVLALRIRMNAMLLGSMLTVRASDPAAPEDLPAWCRMSGHTLVDAQHPIYSIRRKGE